jgi:hypothetical protein
MSWNVNFTGRAEKVVEALKAEAEKLTGQSGEEYRDALPHLVGLVEQNLAAGAAPNPEYPKMVVVQASGHGSKKDGVWVDRNCSVSVGFNYTRVLL